MTKYRPYSRSVKRLRSKPPPQLTGEVLDGTPATAVVATGTILLRVVADCLLALSIACLATNVALLNIRKLVIALTEAHPTISTLLSRLRSV